jgi:HAD superfamily PSPase-like hydrolase
LKFKLVVFDLDGVLVNEPSAWGTLHHAFGTYQASKKNLSAYEAGTIDYPEFMRRDIRLWGDRSVNEVECVLLDFTLTENALETCDALREENYQLAILSAGIDILARAVSQRLGIECWIANGLVVNEGGFLTGEGIFRVDLKAKDRALGRLIKPLAVELPDVVAVGDSKYDIALMESCGAGIAFVRAGRRDESHSWARRWKRIQRLCELPATLLKIEEEKYSH